MTYTTTQGDMWDTIAHEVYGNELFMSQLIAANPQYRRTFVFPSGIVLNIPDVQNGVATPPWRR